MAFTRRGRRREALARPFPEAWRRLLLRNVRPWRSLNSAERTRLEELIRIILVDKNWEAADGFRLTDDMRVIIAAMACLLILELDYDYYHRVTSIIVTPTTMVQAGDRSVGDGLFTDEPEDVIGLAHYGGPVVIAWDAVRAEARDRHRGHNVVYHEFAHKLDMLNGTVDGTPPLESREEYRRWAAVGGTEYSLLRDGGGGDLLDPYGAEDSGEFFAVVTEVFFDRPVAMEAEKPELYAMLRDFYRQDPAGRERRAGGSTVT
jgi:Mlc titration factor MtfA (ptsG expression regulator)